MEEIAKAVGIFEKMIAEGLMMKADPEILSLEFIAPVTLMIQVRDRGQTRRTK